MDYKALFHITQVTHSSRTSERMKNFKVPVTEPVRLTLEEEIELTKWVTKVVKKHKFIIFSYNSCCDHIHLIMYCKPEILEDNVQKIKYITSNKYKQINKVNLWAQKFNRKPIDTIDGFSKVVNYVENNRMKHNLPESEELIKEIQKMLTPFDNYS